MQNVTHVRPAAAGKQREPQPKQRPLRRKRSSRVVARPKLRYATRGHDWPLPVVLYRLKVVYPSSKSPGDSFGA
eukprot:11154948-Lingulodinium_polyedra.AAC.1